LDVGEWKYYKHPISERVKSKIINDLKQDNPSHGYGCIPEKYGLNNPHSSEIMLIHDHPKFIEVFKSVIQSLLDNGYKFEKPINLNSREMRL